jgi:ribonuclease E
MEHGSMEHGAMEHGTIEHGAIEPELADAVADFGGPPVATERMEPAAPTASAPREPEFGRTEPPASEPPRRRSTVREPVRFPIEDEAPQYTVPPSTPSPAPSAPQPVTPERAAAPETADQPQDDDGKPRRTGWWAKRLMGG